MRIIILSILLFISNFIFAQDAKTIQGINHVIQPKFYFDTSQQNYNPCFYDVDTINNNIIVRAWNRWNTNDSEEIGKVFVLKKINNQLSIIDSSAMFGVDGRGPRVYVKKDTIFIEHGCHGCTYENTYLFNNKKQKYLLLSLEYSEVIRSSEPSHGNVPIGVRKKFYRVSKQELTTEIWDDYETELKSKKISKKPLPKNLIPDLAHYTDPEGDEYDIYDKIF